MIRTFRNKDTEAVFGGTFVKGLDLMIPPSNQLEALKGDRAGQHSIRINKQWRICFKWQNGDVLDVEIVDYH
ncbi:MAG: type II toxin-antitoxin system RelE/ParE family toxin [Steroidobacteraceae bacterium]